VTKKQMCHSNTQQDKSH